MEDDIDIEEHDVLEHPRIKNIFPDLSRVKTEIPDSEYQDDAMDYETYEDNESTSHATKSTGSSEYARYGNKIILGSKPSISKVSEKHQNPPSVLVFGRKPVQIKQEIEDNYEGIREELQLNEGHHNQSSPVLILGSKPSKNGVLNASSTLGEQYKAAHSTNVNTSRDEEIDTTCDPDKEAESDCEYDIKDSFVSLEDWGPKLENSPCFCKECEILFPTTNTLLAHNMTAHSFLVAVDKNKAVKSTAKQNKAVKRTTNAGVFCNHCDKVFPNNDSLINHLYQKLTFDKKIVFKTQPKKADVANSFKQASFQARRHLKAPEPTKSVSDESEHELKENMFRCCVCFTYFRGKLMYLKHMRVNHSQTNPKIKRVPFDSICVFCKRECGNKIYYSKHVSRSHPDKFTLKCPEKQRLNLKPQIHFKPQLSSNKTTFHCYACKEVLSSYTAARCHRKMKHPEMKNWSLFQKIRPTKTPTQPPSWTSKFSKLSQNVYKPVFDPKSLAPDISPQKSSDVSVPYPLVPKSILFKCNNCVLHFTTCSSALLHFKSCSKSKGDWKCEICHRDFKSWESVMHKLQHKYTEDFRVYICEDNMYGRVLNQCPDCEVYLDEKNFLIHTQPGNCDKSSVICKNCTLPIHASIVDEHKVWHERVKMKRQDMILVEFTQTSEVKIAKVAVKRGLDFVEASESKRPKTSEGLFPAYFCYTCSTFMFSLRYKEYHIKGQCKRSDNKKSICKTCGLTITSGDHKRFHKDNPKITLTDMIFMTVKDKHSIAPPIPDYPKCNRCSVHFCSRATISTHDCKDTHKVCKYCNKKFSDLAHKLHVRFHEYTMKIKTPVSTLIPKSKLHEALTSPIPQKSENSQLPELLKKYQMLTDTWNILFLCSDCDIVCDAYDTAVEHCQKHFNKMESYDVIVKKCQTCDLKFDSTCFGRHRALHAQNASINKDSFRVVEYRYTRLFSQAWFDQFRKHLPYGKVQQIVSRSIYSTCKSVKLRVIQEGAPETTLYKCGKCETFTHPVTLSHHYKSVNCDKNKNKWKCRHCGILISTVKARKQHEKLHKTHFEFKIVHFNEPGDEEFNEKLRENVNTSIHAVNHYYMCESCKCCMTQKKQTVLHECKVSQPTKCNICRYSFHVTIFRRHLKMHEFNPRFNRKNIKISLFKPNGGVAFKNPEKSRVKLYKCLCGVHFTSPAAIAKHSEVCKTETEISKEKCSKCGRLFNTAQLVTHLCKHHTGKNNTDFEVVVVKPDRKQVSNEVTLNKNLDPKKCLYKCHKCDVFYLSTSGLAYHELSHELSKVLPCPICKLKFMPQTLQTHIEYHHDKHNLKLEDLHVKVGVPIKGTNRMTYKLLDMNQLPQYSQKGKAKSATNNKIIGSKAAHKSKQKLNLKNFTKNLYRCDECRTHFLSAKALKSHNIMSPHPCPNTKCVVCQYAFTPHGLQNHLFVHHEVMKLKRRDFRIISNQTGQDFTKNEVTNNKNSESRAARPPRSVNMVYEDDFDMDDHKTSDDVSLGSTAIGTNNNLQNTSQRNENEVNGNSKNTFKFENIIYKCCFCDLHYFSDKYLRDVHFKAHLSDDPQCRPESATCFCGLTFPATVFARHQIMHHVKQNLSKADIHVITPNAYGDDTGHNHLFRCNICDLNYLNLDSLEQHIRNVEHNTKVYTRCDQCGLLFKKTTLLRHVIIHHEVMKLDSNDFIIMLSAENDKVRILNSTEETTYGENSSTTFENLTTDGNVEVAKNSTSFKNLKNDKNVKVVKKDEPLKPLVLTDAKKDYIVELAQTSVSEAAKEYLKYLKLYQRTHEITYTHIIYRCGICSLHFLTVGTLATHHQRGRHNIRERVTCLICDLEFSVRSIAVHVKFHHKKLKLSLKDFNITEDLGDVKNMNTDSRLTPKPDSLSEDDSMDDLHDIYDIRKQRQPLCANKREQSTPTTNDSLSQDESVDEVNTTKTENEISNISTQSHEFSDRERIMTPVVGSVTNAIYQCEKCSLNFNKFETLSTHYPMCTKKTVKARCKICNLFFSNKSMKNHINYYHRKLNLSFEDFKIIYMNSEDKRKTEIYQCDKCSLNFNKHNTLSKHYPLCANKMEKIRCQFCNLFFSTFSLKTHIDFHHRKLNLSLEDLRIINVNAVEISFGKQKDLTSTSDKTKAVCEEDEPPEITDQISTLNSDLYTNNLFKCCVCSLHFLTEESLNWHTENSMHGVQKSHCTFCGLVFTVKTLPTHIFIHHEKLDLTVQHFNIISSDKSEENIADVDRPTTSFAGVNSSVNNFELESEGKMSPDVEFVECAFTESSDKSDVMESDILSDSNVESNLENIPIVNNEDESEMHETDKPTRISNSEIKKREETGTRYMKLYKCADCNVCFLCQPTCYKHVKNHVPLDAKDYIECKLCDYQFLIIHLHKHISKHHRENFKHENILIEEYNPNVLSHGSPKIEIYFGNDRVQSKLVSTTTEANEGKVAVEADVEQTETIIPDLVPEFLDLENNPDEINADSSKSIHDSADDTNIISEDLEEVNATIVLDG